MEFQFDNTFDANKYPELSADPALSQIVETKVIELRRFMDKMKGGIRNMRCVVNHNNTEYKVLVCLT